LLYYPNRASLDYKALPEEFQELGEGLVYFGEMLLETRTLAKDISRGELDCKLPSSDNEMAASLKSLHATLKHLTWQVQQVAKGDYNQQVSFIGEFADAVNEMIFQLRERRDAAEAEMCEIQRKTNDLTRSNLLFETISSTMNEWIVLINRETKERLFTNHPVSNDLAKGITEAQLYNMLFDCAKGLDDNDEPRIKEFLLHSEYAAQWFRAILYPIKWYEHNAVACVLKDITDEKAQMQKLKDVAYKDMLTETYNRHYGMKLLNEWIQEHCHFVIGFIDMDKLKYVNDVFGHAEGDKYILKVAEILAGFSPNAEVIRLGGDEFMLLVKDTTLAEADKRLEDLRSELISNEYVSKNGKVKYKRSISYGNVEVKKDNQKPAGDLLSLADDKMYKYKKDHKAERME
jgi:diguanylate cyclase (GGDEF)-like protein